MGISVKKKIVESSCDGCGKGKAVVIVEACYVGLTRTWLCARCAAKLSEKLTAFLEKSK